jgi:hypothetical protein
MEGDEINELLDIVNKVNYKVWTHINLCRAFFF